MKSHSTTPKPYELFQQGSTVGVFQYESDGMQKYMKELKPNQFADLIAMNALYRPGPLAYIPNFINRKHGREEIKYDLPAMEENLKETYGITVYQEQVMLLSQKLANFSKGEEPMCCGKRWVKRRRTYSTRCSQNFWRAVKKMAIQKRLAKKYGKIGRPSLLMRSTNPTLPVMPMWPSTLLI